MQLWHRKVLNIKEGDEIAINETEYDLIADLQRTLLWVMFPFNYPSFWRDMVVHLAQQLPLAPDTSTLAPWENSPPFAQITRRQITRRKLENGRLRRPGATFCISDEPDFVSFAPELSMQ